MQLYRLISNRPFQAQRVNNSLDDEKDEHWEKRDLFLLQETKVGMGKVSCQS